MGRMEGLHWLLNNWFTVLSAVGVVGGLFFTAFSLRSETKTRKISNLIAMTANHREIWKQLFQRPELARVVDSTADVTKRIITPDEEAFVSMVVIHTSSVYEALKDELLIKQEGLRRDVGLFISLPIPRVIWEKIKLVQNQDFVAFVEMCRRGAAVVKVVVLVVGFVKRSLGAGILHGGEGHRLVPV